jgi:hypothetical protein
LIASRSPPNPTREPTGSARHRPRRAHGPGSLGCQSSRRFSADPRRRKHQLRRGVHLSAHQLTTPTTASVRVCTRHAVDPSRNTHGRVTATVRIGSQRLMVLSFPQRRDVGVRIGVLEVDDGFYVRDVVLEGVSVERGDDAVAHLHRAGLRSVVEVDPQAVSASSGANAVTALRLGATLLTSMSMPPGASHASRPRVASLALSGRSAVRICDCGESVRAVGHRLGQTLLSARDPSHHRASGSPPTGNAAPIQDEAPVSAGVIK